MSDSDGSLPSGTQSLSSNDSFLPARFIARCTPENYTKGKMLGAGAFGHVYLCENVDTGLVFAAKQVNFDQASDETSKEVVALRNEIELLHSFDHPRIVQYLGSEEKDGTLSLFIEYMPGGSVTEQIKQNGPFTEIRTRKYAQQILEGLAFLHGKRIIHRDVKGGHVLCDLEGNIKLAGFGVSELLDNISLSHTEAGTCYYMSPELVKGDGYDQLTDIWSFGCTVVEMLTGNHPWHKLEAVAAMFRIGKGTAPEYDLLPTTTDLAKNFLERCFIQDYKQRPPALELLMEPFVDKI